MTIKKRLTYSSIILVTLLLGTGTVNWLGNNAISRNTEYVVMLEKATMHVQGIFRGVNEFIIDEGEPLSIELTKKHVAAFDEIHISLKNTDHFENKEEEEDELHHIFDKKVSPEWATVKNSILSFMKDNPYISVEDDTAMLEYGKIISNANSLLEHVEELSAKITELAAITSNRTKNVINIVTFAVLGIIIFILYNIYHTISSPIKELIEVAESFSRGDISIIMNDNRKDEFGKVASHFNTATYKMNDMIAGVQNLTDSIMQDSDHLSSASVQIDKNANEQSNQTGQAASAMEELNSSFIDVAKNTSHAAESSKAASDLAVQGGEIVSETILGINKISQVVNESANNIEDLGSKSEQVGEIIKVINDIAGQTNLLALNAAIEAARAGEQGRGFAVVADEVRKLAERTTAATNEISDMIKGFQGGTQKAVESMQSGTREVEEGVKLSNKAGDSLKQIVASANNVTEMVRQIAIAAEEQSTTGDVIAANVEAIAGIAQQTANSANESATSARDMNSSILKLKQLVSVFTLRHETLNNTGTDVTSREDHPNEVPHPSS